MRRFLWCMAIILIAKSALQAENKSNDWYQFRGPDRSGLSSSTDLLTVWPADGPPLVWKTSGAGRGYASVAISDGKLFTIGDGPSTAEDENAYLLCFDLESGSPLWKTQIGDPWTEGPSDWQSSRSTPTIDGSRAYCLTAHGDLVCCDVAQGTEIWRRNLKSDFGGKKGDSWGYSESVLVDGDKLICTPGGEENTMIALDKSNGDMIWSAVREGDRGAGHASIVVSEIGTTRVYVQTTASGALGVRADDGKLMWSYEIDKTTAVIPTPIVRDDLVFFTAGYGRGGALLRQIANEGNVTIEEVYPLKSSLENKHGGLVLVGDYLYGDSGDNGIPFCAELLTGANRWKQRSKKGKGSASITAADGHLYILFSGNATMALAKANPRRYDEISTFRIDEGSDRPAWAHPVVTDGHLFLRKDDDIYCFDLRAK